MIESPRHNLDEAIDRVAAKMVAVPGDDRRLQNVMAGLPERQTSPWFMHMGVQGAAAAALVLMAFVWARPARESRPIEPPMQAVAAPAASPRPESKPSLEAEPAVARDSRIPVPDSRHQSPIDRLDHERSLAPVEPLQALALEPIAPAALEPEAAAVVAPLVMTALTLEGGSSQRDH